ncbi:MAG TPA: T9SS type A sorting domain-containing protein [Chitinophagales bacterium]|nr:T9SS type A sorting domain-containing protein [Chitinophagales bacterium]
MKRKNLSLHHNQKSKSRSVKLTDISKTLAALAATILIPKSDNAQVIYTDINPDVTLLSNQSYDLDLDNDGTVDYTIKNKIGFGTSAELISSHSYNQVASALSGAAVFNAGNSIVGNQFDYGGGLLYEKFNGGHFGPWQNRINKYAGLKMYRFAAQHYGWVRMDVTQNPMKIVVKDYGYNNTGDEHIVAAIDVPGFNEPLTIYSNESTVYIEAPTNISDGRIFIYNLLGSKVYEQTLEGGNSKIVLENVSAGIYLIQINCNGFVFSRKIELK